MIEDLAGRINIVLDAGPTEIGVESTVINMISDPPEILRPGGTSYERLKEVLGKVKVHPLAKAEKGIRLAQAVSPGMKHKHYAPEAEMIVVEGTLDKVIKKVQQLAETHATEGKKIGILGTDESIFNYQADVVRSLGSRKNSSMLAKNLFELLRQFDKEKVDVIIVEGISLVGLGLAVMNRLRKASGFNIIRV